MTALQVLRTYGRMPAQAIADVLGCAVEDVYPELVSAEARGLVRVLTCRDQSYREWECVRQVSA